MPTYTDQQVMAAFNSCIDLAKYRGLPQQIKDRLCSLIRAHRIKPVCFMEACGLGLRVYMDALRVSRVGDEVTINGTYTGNSPATNGCVDVDGSWLRCPAELYEKKEDEWIVLDETGRRYLKIVDAPDEDEDSDAKALPDDDESRYYDWYRSRGSATIIANRTDADFIARGVKGAVVKVG